MHRNANSIHLNTFFFTRLTVLIFGELNLPATRQLNFNKNIPISYFELLHNTLNSRRSKNIGMFSCEKEN